MKELSIKEKAKRYDEAIERAKAYHNDYTKDIMEGIFPELKESEDKSIRKWLIELVKEIRKANPTNVEHNGMCSDAIAWLEKQGMRKGVGFPTKWSEEDNNAIKVLKNIIGKSEMIDSIIYTDGLKERLYDWLKSLRPQKYVGYNPYKAAIESIAEMCKHYDVLSHSGLRDFYDNVKVKCKEPIEYDKEYFQKQWNPSEEQMKVLHNYAEQNNYDGAILTSLYNDLKQL